MDITADESRVLKSAAPAIGAIVAFAVVWDVVMCRMGWESISSTWKRWGRQQPVVRLVLSTSVACLDRHLADNVPF